MSGVPATTDSGAGSPALAALPLGTYLAALAEKTPAPGGGAVAAVTLATAAALGRMVLEYSIGRKKLAAHAELHQRAMEELTRHGDDLLRLADDDAASYAALNELLRLGEEDPRRREALPAAVEAAIAAPRRMSERGAAIATRLGELAGATNPHLDSDLAIAAALAECGVEAAVRNVRANLPLVVDEAVRRRLAQEADAALETAKASAARVRGIVDAPA